MAQVDTAVRSDRAFGALSRIGLAVGITLCACNDSHMRHGDSGVETEDMDVAPIDLGWHDAPPLPIRCDQSSLPLSAFVPDTLNAAQTGPLVRSRRADGVDPFTGEASQQPPHPTRPVPANGQNGAPQSPSEDQAFPARPNNCGGDPISGYAWDGQRCRGVLATYCGSGQSCAGLMPNLAECETRYAECNPQLCRNTQGVWSELSISCNEWKCGVLDVECNGISQPQCVCPVGHSFVSGQGCVADPTCEADALKNGCAASGGVWRGGACGDYRCGEPSPLACASEGCDCGPLMNFNRETHRCEPDNHCTFDEMGRIAATQRACTWSGGTWSAWACNHAVCGVLNGACDETPGACNCGPYGVFDENQGCVLAPYCRTNMCF